MNFCQVFRPISTSLSPNTQWDDVFLALKLLPQPWKWKISVNQRIYQRKSDSTLLEEEFKKYLGVNFAYSFNSGRSGLMAILTALGIKDKDEVLIQAFTCNAVPNPILWSGGKPIYVDIDGSASSPQVTTLNIDPEDLERKITPKSKAVIIQNTFGQPTDMDRILEIAHRHNLYVIEDCAHSLGAQYKGKLVGTMGDITFFSFGRDKVISSVFGGMVTTNNSDLAQKIQEFQKNCKYPSYFWIFQQLWHPVVFKFWILPFYYLCGRFALVFLQKIKLLSMSILPKEKHGEKPNYFPQKMPGALAILALNQLKKLEKFNQHRRKIAQFYEEHFIRKFAIDSLFVDKIPGGIYWRYPIFVKNPRKVIKKAKRSGILFDDGWQESSIVPPGTNLEKMQYEWGSCPRAEKVAKTILSLPTHINISTKDAKKVVDALMF